MSLFYTAIRFLPFWVIPAILLLIELTLFFVRKKSYLSAFTAVLVIIALLVVLVLFFQQGGFIHFLPWIRGEIEAVTG